MRALALLLAVAFAAGCMQAEEEPTRAPPTPAREPVYHRVSIESYAYVPATIEIEAGDAVVWTNDGPYGGYYAPAPTHTATAEDGSWTTYRIDYPAEAIHTFASAGTWPYKCNFHANMTGTVVVR